MTARPAVQPGAFLSRLQAPGPLEIVELRPPRAGLSGGARLDSWIDQDDATRRLLGSGLPLFFTDDAVGVGEEENLRHLASVIESAEELAQVVPFLTCKHTLEYCLLYAERAAAQGFEALTVLGGDRGSGPPRCLPHAYLLRERIRAQVPDLALGGWVNPHREIEAQVRHLTDHRATAEFFLTQVVSHHHIEQVERFLEAAERAGLDAPIVWGVFYYRSPNPGTLATLDEFFPVPREALAAEFDAGADATEVCARTIRALRSLGVEKVYLSNFGTARPERIYREVMARV